jgi:hypothetical protein
VALHPVDVAAQRIDLAVMGEDAEGLRQRPGREGVGRVALVIDGEGRNEALVEKVRVECGQLLGEEHALVDDRAAAQRAEIEVLDLVGDDPLLDAPANDVEVALELVLLDAFRVRDEYLLDLGPGRVRLLADDVDIDRNLPPAVDPVAEGENLRFDDGARTLLRVEIGARQEDHADRELARLRLGADRAHMVAEEILRDLHMDAGTVAGLAVGVDGAAMPDGFEGIDGREYDRAARLTVERGDEADAARVVLLGRIVEPVPGEIRGVTPEFVDLPDHILSPFFRRVGFICSMISRATR